MAISSTAYWPSARNSCSSRCTGAAARTARCRTCWRRWQCPTRAPTRWQALCAWTRCCSSACCACTTSQRRAFHSFNETAFRELGGARTFPKLLEELSLPAVVKPVAQGSAIGIKFVTSAEQLPSAILGAFGYGDRVLVEQRVLGRELAVTVLDSPGGEDGPRALPVVELFTPESFYSYEAHYTIGQLRMEVPAQLSEQVRARVEQVALESYALMGCRDFARVDLILDEHEVPQVLEINTIPGLTETGITTAAAEAAGMSFAELVEAIVARVVALS